MVAERIAGLLEQPPTLAPAEHENGSLGVDAAPKPPAPSSDSGGRRSKKRRERSVETPPPLVPLGNCRDLIGEPVGLRLDGVKRVFRQGELGVTALEETSFEIAPGEFVAISGPSGSGKTTLLQLLGGLDRPTSGRVYAAGTFLDQISEDELADFRLQRVGTVFEEFHLISTLSLADNVSLPLVLAGVPAEERERRVARLLEIFGLSHKAAVRPNRLSGGEKQRAAVARALANRPGLILADEPTGKLDSASGKVVLDLLSELNRLGATVVMVTHDPTHARRAGRVFRMRDGRVSATRSRRRAVRAPVGLEQPLRLSPRDSLGLGLSNAVRSPLRTGLTAAGVGLGISLLTAILALASGAMSSSHSTAAVGRALIGLAGMAFLVAVLSVLNTMYAAVMERTREIGVLKALGARGSDLLLLFMAESAVIGLVAGIAGVVFGSILALFGNWIVGAEGLFHMDAWIAVSFLLLAVVLSALAGVIPAMRGAAMDPARVLRQA